MRAVLLGILLLWTPLALAAVQISESTTVNLYDGTRILEREHTRESCRARAAELLKQLSDGTRAYACEERTRFVGVFEPDPPPPPPPVELAAPVLSLERTPGVNPGRVNVKLTWAAVAGAAEYVIERCSGPSCSAFTLLGTTVETQLRNTNLPDTLTLKYRGRAIAPGRAGPYSEVVTTAPPAAQPGEAIVTIDQPGSESEYLVVYGRKPAELDRAVLSPAGARIVLKNLEPGPWYIAACSFSRAQLRAGPASNIVLRNVT